MSMKNFNHTIGNRTRDLPACSAVPQPTALLGANNRRNTMRVLLSTAVVLSGDSTCSKHGLGRRLEEIHGGLDPTILWSSCYICH